MTNFYYTDQTYDTSFHYHCLKNCFRQILEYYGVLNAYLYIDVASRFSVTVPKDLEYCTVSNDIASLDVIPVLSPYVKQQQFNDPQTAEFVLSKNLATGSPVIVTVDTFYLPYQLTYNKYHGSHAIIICSESGKDYQIVDWYEPHYFKGCLSKKDLRLSRGAQCNSNDNPFSKINTNYYSWLFQRDISEQLAKISGEFIFEQSIQNVYNNFYNQEQSFLYNNKFFGTSALEKWINYISHIFESEYTLINKNFFQELHNSVFLLYITKRLLKYYIFKYKKNFSDVEKALDIDMNSIIEAYQNLLFIIMKIKMLMKGNDYKKIIDIMKKILSQEIEVGMKIKKMIKGVN